jgi:protein-S-isoprenylcysteine O-methyltransferase Ste14
MALLLGLFCHVLFAAAVTSMAYALANGMQSGLGPFHGASAVLVNGLLVVQFPLLHSWLLTKRGGRALAGPFGPHRGSTLASTTYAIVASLQLLCTFWCWSPSDMVWHRPTGLLGALQWILFAGSWLFLLKAIRDAGMGVQTGFAGWWALYRGRSVAYGGMPERGLFSVCRQPIYLGFALVLWTAPAWSLDGGLLALLWGAYCVLGPIYKERRFAARYGDTFSAYRARVPYFLPRRMSRP